MLQIFRQSWRVGRVTPDYPRTPEPAPPGYRGRPVLAADRCDGAAACARVCPTRAITIAPSDAIAANQVLAGSNAAAGAAVPLSHVDAPLSATVGSVPGAISDLAAGSAQPNPASTGEATPGSVRWRLDLAACVQCGLCADACPSGALTLTNDYELAVRDPADLVTTVTYESPTPAQLAAAGLPAPNGASHCEGVIVDATALSANGDHQPDPECGVAADQIATVSNVTQRPLTAGLAIPIQRLPALTNGSHTADPDSPARLAADVSRLNGRIRALLRRSLHVRHLDAGSCNGCDWEIGALTGAIYDVQRLGVDVVASPRHADAVLVTGIVTRHLEPALLATYEAMPRPGLVIAVGACACGGGPFEGSYAVVGPVDRRLPVDVYIPGCPPRPHALIHGLLVAMDRLAPKLARSELTIPADTP